MHLVIGNTFPVKEQIKALGGKWNRAAQGWMLPDPDSAAQAEALVAAAPADPGPPPRARYPRRHYGEGSGSIYTRFSSGAEAYQNSRGRCEDAPCCGCCS